MITLLLTLFNKWFKKLIIIMSDSQLDLILKELGQFGKFQIINYLLIAIPLTLSAAYTLSYVFTAGDLDYRYVIKRYLTKKLINLLFKFN